MPALEGVQVLELAQTPIAALCSMILGDFGADILKIDSPAGAGVFAPSVAEAVYHPIHRNKRNMALNLRSDEGRSIFLALAEKADVVIDGFRPGVMQRLGIDYKTLSNLNQRIICCSISGFGQDGPYEQLPGHDINYISIGGALGLLGKSGGPPSIPLNWIADWAGGVMHATIGILLALMARERSGRGQYVDISMTDGVVALLGAIAPDFFRSGLIPKRGEMVLSGSYPYYNVYETRDGTYISIGCLEPVFWQNLCRELGREDFAAHGFANEHMNKKAEGKEWAEISSFLTSAFLTKTSDEWIELLGHKNIPITKVYELDEVFSDAQIRHRNMVVEVDHPEAGKVKQIGIAIKLSDTPGEIRSLSPRPGEHTRKVLQDLGYSDEEIGILREGKVIG